MTVHGTHCDNVSSQPFNCSSEFLDRLATSSSAPEDNNTSDVPRRGAEDKERKGVPNTTRAEEYTSEQEEAVKRYHDDLVLRSNHIHRSFVLGYRDACTLHFSSVQACPISVFGGDVHQFGIPYSRLSVSGGWVDCFHRLYLYFSEKVAEI